LWLQPILEVSSVSSAWGCINSEGRVMQAFHPRRARPGPGPHIYSAGTLPLRVAEIPVQWYLMYKNTQLKNTHRIRPLCFLNSRKNEQTGSSLRFLNSGKLRTDRILGLF